MNAPAPQGRAGKNPPTFAVRPEFPAKSFAATRQGARQSSWVPLAFCASGWGREGSQAVISFGSRQQKNWHTPHEALN